jgi:hypothetical protein
MSERIVSGSVKGDGKVLEGEGFHASRTGPGRYLIVFRPPLSKVGSGMARLIDTRQAGQLQAQVSSMDGLHAAISVSDQALQGRDCAFSFVFTGESHSGAASPQPADPLAPAAAMLAPSIGSPAPPVLSFPRQQEATEPPADTSLTGQIERLKQTMQDVLRPLQRENLMLKSRLAMVARQANGGRKITPAANAFPDMAAGPLLTRLLHDYRMRSVLDLGQPDLRRLALLAGDDRAVTAVADPAVTVVSSPQVTLRREGPSSSEAGRFDCVLAVDLLQWQADPKAFLRMAHAQLVEGGVLALSVPALRYPQINGELSIWSGGLLLQHLVLAGFDCRKVKLLTLREEIYLLLEKASIEPTLLEGKPVSIATLRAHLPDALTYLETPQGLTFNGDVPDIGWAD